MSPAENEEPGPSETPPNNRRRKKSIVWEHFTVETVGAGCTRACCKQCKQTFAYSTGSKLSGTSHLKRHIALGTCLGNRRKEKSELAGHTASTYKMGNGCANDSSRKRHRDSSFSVNLPFDHDLCRREIAKMIIMHEYPLDMVEHLAFLSFIQTLQPQFDMVNLDTVQGDCFGIYHEEKQEVVKLLEGITGRISLSVDLWTSSQTLGYAFLTAHFFSNGWKLESRILNVVVAPSSHSTDSLCHAVGICISDWGLEGKLFSITCNKCLLKDDAVSLKGYLSVKNPLILDGQLLVNHCYAHILSSIAQEAVQGMHKTIDKVRESVKYIKTSQTHETLFLEIKQELQLPGTELVSLDDQTQWNTTYQMLVSAMELKEAFSCLEAADPDFKSAPSVGEWEQVQVLCKCLKDLYDAANVLSGTMQPTTNLYFHQAVNIQLELMRAAASEDPLTCNFNKPLKEKFDTYWKSCRFLLATAVVMDPRFKMKLVELSFSRIYGDEANTYINIVDEGIHELFSEYSLQLLPPPTYCQQENTSNVKTEESLQVLSDRTFRFECEPLDFDVCISDGLCYEQTMLELDMYLEGSLVPSTEEFDILNWWKLNSIRYPTLSKMAHDLLCIPMSTIPYPSMFDTGGRQLDRYRSSLQPEMLQALVCAKDWLHSRSAEPKNALVKKDISILS